LHKPEIYLPLQPANEETVFSKAIRKIKKIKFAVTKKVLTFAVPKQGALKSEKTESDFQFKN
jgi:hypothetical protein